MSRFVFTHHTCRGRGAPCSRVWPCSGRGGAARWNAPHHLNAVCKGCVARRKAVRSPCADPRVRRSSCTRHLITVAQLFHSRHALDCASDVSHSGPSACFCPGRTSGKGTWEREHTPTYGFNTIQDPGLIFAQRVGSGVGLPYTAVRRRPRPQPAPRPHPQSVAYQLSSLSVP